jgi:hypothetical protein
VFAAGQSKLLPKIESIDPQASVMPLAETLFLNRLKPVQARAYILHRLGVASAPGSADLFESDATAEIQRYTGGTPRLINILCDSSMCVAANRQSARVSLIDVAKAVQELQWTEFASPVEGSLAQAQIAGTPAMRRELIVTRKGAPYAQVELQRGKMVVGRSPECGLRLESNFVSREHFQIITSADGCFVKDLGSTNGILINGLRMHLRQLQHDDVVEIAEFQLTYQETPRRGPQPEPPQVSHAAKPTTAASARALGDTEVQPAIGGRGKRRKQRQPKS